MPPPPATQFFLAPSLQTANGKAEVKPIFFGSRRKKLEWVRATGCCALWARLRMARPIIAT